MFTRTRTLTLGCAIVAPALIGGCAHHKPMALQGTSAPLDLSKQSVVFFSLRTENEYKPAFKPVADLVVVEERGAEPDDLNVREAHRKDMSNFAWRYKYGGGKGWHYFTVGKCQRKSDKSNEYLISLALVPGKYRLRYIAAAMTELKVDLPYAPRGWCFIPVYADFDVAPGAVVYLGRIEATNRHRRDDSELRTGPVVPLLQQAVMGISDGTFRIKSTDAYEEDVVSASQLSPSLQESTVTKNLLRLPAP
jgi:hypothetical protein